MNLTTLDCLELILEVGSKHQGSIHVSFSFGYDVNQLLKDLPVRALHLLRENGAVYWEGYHIEHVPRKWLVVRGNGTQVKIFDTFLFFNCKFGEALRKYNVGTPEDLDRIDKGKEERPNFTWVNIDEIEHYWETELKYGVELLNKLREIIYGAGFHITSWHGPGALASYALGSNNTHIHMDRSISTDINLAARYAMFGGRFQAFQVGYYDGTVYDRDINSAYAYAFSRLPSLANGKWHYEKYPDRESAKHVRLGLYHIRYHRKMSNRPMPLPHRERTGTVSFPSVTNGWFHAVEAASVVNDVNAEFLEAWIFEDDGSYPFSWIPEAFEERRILQEQGNPAEKTIKWMLAALYGQAAQRAGWKHKNGPPKWHQIEWAGAVTAECRSMVYNAAKQVQLSLVSIDTDGFISLAPPIQVPNGIGENLGQWKATEYSGILYLQNGIYWLRDKDTGEWLRPKSRGIPRKKLDFDEVYPMLQKNENLKVSQHMYIGYGLALRGQMDKWRKWIDVPREITFGGNGKAVHVSKFCPTCKKGISWAGGMHPVFQVPPETIDSSPYDLPWMAETEEKVLKEFTEVED